MTGKGVSPDVGAVLPFGGIRIASSSVSEVAVFHLSVVGEPLVHRCSCNIYEFDLIDSQI